MHNQNNKKFDQLYDEAMKAVFKGWDFSFLDGRYITDDLPWDYKAIVSRYLSKEKKMLDIDTGGGELLLSFTDLPDDVSVTECYEPNLELVKKTLVPRGVKVYGYDPDYPLPFEPGLFDLITNRHGSFLLSNILDILKQGGYFITQQVGGHNCLEINHYFNDYSQDHNEWDLGSVVKEAGETGFRVVYSEEAFVPTKITDIGALVYYLKAIPWQIPEFRTEEHRKELSLLDQSIRETGFFRCTEHRFICVLQKPRL